MNISPGERIAGFHALKLRDMLRRVSDDFISKRQVAALLGISQKKALELLQNLEKEGYLESETYNFNKKKELYWQLTPKGAGLRMASAARPIKRTTADRLLKEVLERVKEINSSPDYLYKVTEVVVFGSYLDESRARMSDLDLDVNLERKEPDIEIHAAKCQDQAIRELKIISNLSERYYYSFYKVIKRLKNRSTGLSIHASDSIIKTGIPTKVVFSAKK